MRTLLAEFHPAVVELPAGGHAQPSAVHFGPNRGALHLDGLHRRHVAQPQEDSPRGGGRHSEGRRARAGIPTGALRSQGNL